MRLHACWGNYEGPHDCDVELHEIMPILRKLEVGGFVLPFANPRHAHEYNVLRDFPLDADQVIVAGVIDSVTNFVEHPKTIAERIERVAEVVGDPKRVLAGTDCGFDTSAGQRRVAEDVVWANWRHLAKVPDRVAAVVLKRGSSAITAQEFDFMWWRGLGRLRGNRLTWQDHRALLEAGGKDRDPWIHAPPVFPHATTPRLPGSNQSGARIQQPPRSAPRRCIDRRRFGPRLSAAETTDLWRQLGNAGWSHDDVLPYFSNRRTRARRGQFQQADRSRCPPAHRHPLTWRRREAGGLSGVQPGLQRRQQAASAAAATVTQARRCSTIRLPEAR